MILEEKIFAYFSLGHFLWRKNTKDKNVSDV